MLKRIILVVALLPGVGAAQTLASFAPENDQKRHVSSSLKESSNGMTEALFNEILDQVKEIYEPLVAAKGARLEVQRDWEDPTVNAYAQQIGSRWIIKMFGGLARHEQVTPDGFALVACHELGHHLGGAPLYRFNTWASNEGQSDYYTTLKCARKIWENESNLRITEERLAAGQVDEVAFNACREAHSNADDRALCARASMGGLSLAKLLSDLSGTGAVSFSTPDPRVVSTTQDSHPAAQCRLDTYFQAALCTVDHGIDPSKNDESTGSCTRAKGFEVGNRPLCWYVPSRSIFPLADL